MAFRHKLFYINSDTRDGGTTNDFTHRVDLRDHDIDRVCILAANIPKSYYMVHAHNTLTLTELGVDYTVTLPIGNYSRRSYKNELKTALNAATGNAWSYDITYPNIEQCDDGKYTITVSGNSGSQPSLTFSANGSLAEMTGFVAGSTVAFTADSLKSANVIKMTHSDIIRIHSDICGTTNDVLQEMYPHVPDYDHVEFSNQGLVQHYSKHLTNDRHVSYRFYLTDGNNEKLDLNGLNWTMTLCVYRQDHLISDMEKMLKNNQRLRL